MLKLDLPLSTAVHSSTGEQNYQPPKTKTKNFFYKVGEPSYRAIHVKSNTITTPVKTILFPR
jgi:hypothetical protein